MEIETINSKIVINNLIYPDLKKNLLPLILILNLNTRKHYLPILNNIPICKT